MGSAHSSSSDDDPASSHGTKGDGNEMHHRIGAERWCVTRHDLRMLRRQVAKAIAEGNIVPTELDQFDPADRTIGPNVYTFVDQFVKPVTSAAGGMSWALLQHPEGLVCDLFVTHAWQEGIFEFTDKVLNSWPSDSKHAYCCMLANPQCLDISDLIKQPSESPFAKALETAKYMLVIPNAKGSIYTRLWCAYEAYLSEMKGKIILTATAPVGQRLLRDLPCTFFLCVLGMVHAIVLFIVLDHDRFATMVHAVYGLTCIVMAACVISPSMGVSWCLNKVCHVSTSLLLVSYFMILARTGNLAKEGGNSIALFVMSVTMNLELLKKAELHRESAELRRSFKGTVKKATCTMDCDRERIMGEIGHRVDEVDATINVLIAAGLSTLNLRKAAEKGVHLHGAGEFGLAVTVGVWGFWVNSAVFELDRSPTTFAFGIAVLAMSVAWAMLVISFQKDKQAFASILTVKLYVSFVVPYGISRSVVLDTLFAESIEELAIIGLMLILLMGALSISLSVAGIGRVAHIPSIGPWLAKFLASRSCRCSNRHAHGSHQLAMSTNSRSSNSQDGGLESEGVSAMLSIKFRSKKKSAGKHDEKATQA